MGPVEPRRLLEETEAELSHSGRDLAGWREVRDLEEHMKKIWKGRPETGTKQGHEPAGEGWPKVGVMVNHRRTFLK